MSYQVSQIKGFFKKKTGETSYDALNKQPISDAELKLNLFSKITSLTSKAIESYIKSVQDVLHSSLMEKFEECNAQFIKHDFKKNDILIGGIVNEVTDAQRNIFSELNAFTRDLSEQVLKPLVDYQKEVSLILKENRKELKEAYDKVEQCRRNLDKSKKDVDTNRRQLEILRTSNAESKKQNEQSKLLIQSEDKKLKCEKELDECERVAIERYDKYTEGLYKSVSEESSLGTYFLDYLKLQQKYHLQVYQKLDHLIPQLSGKITQFTKRVPSFGEPLEDHIDSTNNLSPIIFKLIENMKKQNAHLEEGIFRIAGSRVKMNCLISAINAGYLDLIDFNEFDVHCLASVLKQYLRDLPDSLLCNNLHDEWSLAVNSPLNLKQQTFLNALSKMPKINYENLRYIVKFLSQIADNSSSTKMNSNNIGICFGASLLNTHITHNSSSISNNSIDMSIATSAFEYLVSHHSELFPSNDIATPSLSAQTSSPIKNSETLLPKIRIQTPETIPKNNSYRSSMMLPGKSIYSSNELQKSPALSRPERSTHSFRGHTKNNSLDNRIELTPSPDSRQKSKKIAPAPPPNSTSNTSLNLTNSTSTNNLASGDSNDLNQAQYNYNFEQLKNSNSTNNLLKTENILDKPSCPPPNLPPKPQPPPIGFNIPLPEETPNIPSDSTKQKPALPKRPNLNDLLLQINKQQQHNNTSNEQEDSASIDNCEILHDGNKDSKQEQAQQNDEQKIDRIKSSKTVKQNLEITSL